MALRWVKRAGRRVAPSLAARYELLRYVERNFVFDQDGDEYVPDVRRSIPGIDLDERGQLERIATWTQWQHLFAELRSDRAINTWHGSGDRIHNGFFPTPDAETYAAMIGDFRPRTIVEVGGGFSTLVARKAIDHLRLDCRLIVVDPEPRTEIAHAATSVVASRAENSLRDVLVDLPREAFVFIDSTHIARAGGDVAFLYGEVVPALPRGVVVHVHDVFTPFDYPSGARRRMWAEQYVVEALLAWSPRFEVLLTTHWLSRIHRNEMRRVFGEAVGADTLHFGGSLWFRVRSDEATDVPAARDV